jgi:hypothetical protein
VRGLRCLPENLLPHGEHLLALVEAVAVDGVPPCLELPRLVPATQSGLGDAEKMRRFLDGDDVLGARGGSAGHANRKVQTLIKLVNAA